MARLSTFIVAVFVSATAILVAPVCAGQDDGQGPAPRPSTPQQAQPRKPPPRSPAGRPPEAKPTEKPGTPRRTPPYRPAPRPPSASQPPVQHAVPRPPSSNRPRFAPRDRDWIYPIYPPLTFDLVYGFPYGLYPHWTYGDPWGPYYSYEYGYEAPLPECPPEPTVEAARARLRIDVPQKGAAVFVDGYYVGSVDDFAVDKPPLEVDAGTHRIEIRAAGFETLLFFVNPEAGQTITYRGVLQPVRP